MDEKSNQIFSTLLPRPPFSVTSHAVGVSGDGNRSSPGSVRGLQRMYVRLRPDGHWEDLHHDGRAGNCTNTFYSRISPNLNRLGGC